MQSLATALVVICILFPLLSGGVVFLRFLARRIKNSRPQLEDYLILAAWVLSTGMAISDIIAVFVGQFGESYAFESYADLTVFTKVLFAIQFFHLFSVGLTKISLLVFYKRLFPTQYLLRSANVVLALVIIWMTAFFFTTLFQSWPISQNWTGVGRHLMNEFAMYLALGITDLITDLAILILPIPIIFNLHVRTAQKLAIGAIFGVGFFCTAASGVRVYYLNIINSQSVQDINTYTWYSIDYVIWTEVESSWSIICASLPLLMPLFKGRKSPLLSTLLLTLRSAFTLRSNATTSRERSKDEGESTSKQGSSHESTAPEAYEMVDPSGRRTMGGVITDNEITT